MYHILYQWWSFGKARVKDRIAGLVVRLILSAYT